MLVPSLIEIHEHWFQQNPFILDDFLDLAQIVLKELLLSLSEFWFAFNRSQIILSGAFIKELLVDKCAECLVVKKPRKMTGILLQKALNITLLQMNP